MRESNILIPLMETYLTDGTLKQAVADGYVLVERTTESGVRLGIVGLIDLDDYDFDPKKKTLIRATEGTVISTYTSESENKRECSY